MNQEDSETVRFAFDTNGFAKCEMRDLEEEMDCHMVIKVEEGRGRRKEHG